MSHDPQSTTAASMASQRTGRAFYAPARDVVAYLLSALACAALVAYVSMLVAWAAAGTGG